ncbi:MAG: hypothetical protein Q9186_005023 [Xanthomendoza sp. 1 TL-2023]
MEHDRWDPVDTSFFDKSIRRRTLAPTYDTRRLSPQAHAQSTTSSPLPGSALHNKQYTEHLPFRWPVHFQQALQSLQHYPKSFIHAWLLMAKSLDLSAQSIRDHYQQGSSLSIDQLHAIAILQHLPYHLFLAWYGDDATQGQSAERDDRYRHSIPATCRSSTCSTVWTKPSSSRPSSRSSFASNGPSSDTQEKDKRISKRLQPNPLGDLFEVSEIETLPRHEPVGNDHAMETVGASAQQIEKTCTTYRCTGCNRTFKSMQTWSRHEKEDHEDISFPCMPNGAIEVTADGRRCALCGQEPTEEHLRSHNIERCTQLNPVFKRSDQLKQHLETHGLNRRSRRSDLLVNKWQRVPDKRAWACGFCKALSTSLVDFHRHVAVQHYERGEDRKWDHTKVILGLLSQSHVAGPWERLLASHFRVQSLSCKWSKTKTGCLQTRLALGQEPGDILAEAALDCAIFDRDLLHDAFRRQEPSTLDSFRVSPPIVSGPPVPPKPLSSSPSNRLEDGLEFRAGPSTVDIKPFLELDQFQTPSLPLLDLSPRAWDVYMSHLDHLDMTHQYDFNSQVIPDVIHPMDIDTDQGLGFT